jgi:sulfate adenylyltransferase subunit 2
MVKSNGQNVRVFLFQTGQLDVWSYIEQEQIETILFTFHKRKVFLRDGMIWSHSPYVYQEEMKKLKNELFVLEQ